MKYIVDHDYHIHSRLSPCSGDDEQTPEAILKYAEQNNFSSICLTDHFWDSVVSSPIGKPDFYEHLSCEFISQSLPLPQKEGIKFFFGCECELLCDMTLGISDKTIEKMDFVIIPPNYFHMTPYTLSEEDRP